MGIPGRRADARILSTANWSRESLAWAGGFFEGEGTFGSAQPKLPRHCVMRIQSTDRDALERFQEIAGCGSIRVVTPSIGSGSIKQPFAWEVGGRLNVYALGVALWPFLCSRRRARLAEVIHRTFGRAVAA